MSREPLSWKRAGRWLVLGLGASACLGPTQVTLEVTTNVLCEDLDDTRIVVGVLGKLDPTVPSAVTSACQKQSDTKSRIGSLVLVPGPKSNDGPFGVEIVVGVGQSTESCVPPRYEGGCIVARRSLGYLPHTPLVLPIELDVRCLDIPCNATQTCRKGVCVEAFLEDPLNCTEPGGCDGNFGSGGTTSGSGGAANTGGGNSTGGGTSGGTAGTGSSSSGGTGAAPFCGDGTKDANEACDDNNVVPGDGCSADCREEFILAVDNQNKKLVLLDRVTGDYVRDFCSAPDANPFSPIYATQLPGREVVVTDSSNGNVVRYDVRGAFVDKPITGMIGISQIAALGSTPILANTPMTVEARSSADLSYVSDVGLTDDAYAVESLGDRFFLVAGIAFGEISYFDSQSPSNATLLYNGTGIMDMTMLSDGRLLVPDFGGGTVVELTQTTTPVAPDVIGPPLVSARSVTVTNPFSVFELPDGNWLISTNAGLYVYDPDTSMQLSQKGGAFYRTLEEYVGPLPGEP